MGKGFAAMALAMLTLTAASALEVGDPAPPVKLLDQSGTLRDVSASYGRWAVLTFYPVDGTAGCTKEAISITATLAKIEAAGIDVYGVSTQDVASKQAFCAAQGLKHTLLCDTDKSVSAAYGTLLADRGISGRVTFYIDPTRTIRLIDRAVQVATHGEDILAAVTKLAAEDAKTPLPKLGEPETFGDLRWTLPADWRRRVADGATTLVGPDGLSLTLAAAAGDATKPGALPDGAVKSVDETISLDGKPASRTEWTVGDSFTARLRWGSETTVDTVTVTGPKAQTTLLRRLLAATR